MNPSMFSQVIDIVALAFFVMFMAGASAELFARYLGRAVKAYRDNRDGIEWEADESDDKENKDANRS